MNLMKNNHPSSFDILNISHLQCNLDLLVEYLKLLVRYIAQLFFGMRLSFDRDRNPLDEDASTVPFWHSL